MEDLSHEVIPAILLVGDKNSGKDKVLKGLLGGSDSLILTLDTKYYTARAKIIAAEDIDPGKETEIAWEAVMLIFDTDRKSSFDHVKAWASSRDIEFAEIRACVGCKNGDHLSEASRRQTDWLGAAVSWCTGNQFEYLEVAPGNSKLDQELAENGESQGMQRLRELLEAHMWPGLILKDQNSTDLKRSALSPEPQSKALHSMGFEGAPTDETLSNKPGSHRHSSDDGQLEEDMESFEAMISGMASARQQISSLPDKQRREEAEALTLQLLSKLGFDEATDSDSDSLS